MHICEDITLFHVLYHIKCNNACFPNLCFLHAAGDIRNFIMFFWGGKKGLDSMIYSHVYWILWQFWTKLAALLALEVQFKWQLWRFEVMVNEESWIESTATLWLVFMNIQGHLPVGFQGVTILPLKTCSQYFPQDLITGTRSVLSQKHLND